MSTDAEASWLHTMRGVWPLVAIIALSLGLLFIVTPETLIDWVGVKNAYLLMFVTALLGGLTTFNTVPYLAMLLLLASGGLNPYLLGFASATGVMIGDTLSYLVGYHGAKAVPAMFLPLFERINQLAEKYPRRFPLICFLYGALCPLSNDFITIPSGMARISYLRVMMPLALGNLVFNIGTALFVTNIYDILARWF